MSEGDIMKWKINTAKLYRISWLSLKKQRREVAPQAPTPVMEIPAPYQAGPMARARIDRQEECVPERRSVA
jgi:hypothetical protein